MILAAIILLLLIAFILFVATRPDDFRIERSLSMQARPEQIFPLLNNFHEWEAWSPWEKVDPAVRRSYSGPQQGQAAVYSWLGNKELGEGRMEILESQPFNYLRIQINFYKPFAAQNTIEFRLDDQGATTVVSQAMFGPCNFMSKLMGLFFSMENMVGKKFDEGLLDLKNIVEKS